MSGCCAFFDSLILVTEIYFFSSNISFLLNLANILKREFLPYRSSVSIIFSFQHLGEVASFILNFSPLIFDKITYETLVAV